MKRNENLNIILLRNKLILCTKCIPVYITRLNSVALLLYYNKSPINERMSNYRNVYKLHNYKYWWYE